MAKTRVQLDREIAAVLGRRAQAHATKGPKVAMVNTTTDLLGYLAAHGVTVSLASTGAIRLFDRTAFVSERTAADGRVEITISHQSSRGTYRQRFTSRARALTDIQRQTRLNEQLARTRGD